MVLGSPLQRNLLPGVTHDQAMELAADCLRRAMPTLEDCGVTLAVEPLGPQDGNFLHTAEKGVQLCEMVGSPHCRLHLDCKAMSSESKPIPQLLRENRELLHHFHANDPNLRGPGMGELDFVPIFQALAEIDYRGWVSRRSVRLHAGRRGPGSREHRVHAARAWRKWPASSSCVSSAATSTPAGYRRTTRRSARRSRRAAATSTAPAGRLVCLAGP